MPGFLIKHTDTYVEVGTTSSTMITDPSVRSDGIVYDRIGIGAFRGAIPTTSSTDGTVYTAGLHIKGPDVVPGDHVDDPICTPYYVRATLSVNGRPASSLLYSGISPETPSDAATGQTVLNARSLVKGTGSGIAYDLIFDEIVYVANPGTIDGTDYSGRATCFALSVVQDGNHNAINYTGTLTVIRLDGPGIRVLDNGQGDWSRIAPE